MLSVQRALLGAIKPHMRAILVGFDEESIYIKSVVDQSVTEEDREDLSIIGGEILADFPFINSIVEECSFSNDKPSALTINSFKGFAYMRYELCE